ncbi:MAG TPA: hypothetical protein VF896_05245, partial [Anaerolineales bacterium]
MSRASARSVSLISKPLPDEAISFIIGTINIVGDCFAAKNAARNDVIFISLHETKLYSARL